MIEEIYFENRTDNEFDDLTYEEITNAVKGASEFFDFDMGYQVSISIVDKSEIHELNAKFRGVDRSTDVLSFPMEETDPRGVEILGDIVLCIDVAKEQAESFGHSFQRELAYLSVHSFLHLMGYDHMTEDDKLEMRGMEKEIMKKLGIFKNEMQG